MLKRSCSPRALRGCETLELRLLLARDVGTLPSYQVETVPIAELLGMETRIRDALQVDLNEDGLSDVILATGGSQVVTLLRDSSGGFRVTESNRVLGLIQEIELGFVDDDNLPDILVRTDQQLVVLLNQGSDPGGGANFAPSAPMELIGSTSWDSGDADGDGVLDLAIGTSSSVEILLGVGDGSFVLAPRLLTELTGARDVSFGQFRTGGLTDILVGFGTGRAMLLVNDGQGDFEGSLPVEYLLPFPYESTPQISFADVADLNADGLDDILIAYHATLGFEERGPMYYGLSQGDGTFAQQWLNVNTFPMEVEVRDFDRDGHVDVLLLNADIVLTHTNSDVAGVDTLFFGRGDGTFEGCVGNFFGGCDYDGFLQLDLAPRGEHVRFSESAIEILHAEFDAVLVQAFTWELSAASGALLLRDLQGDGVADIARLRGTGGSVLYGAAEGGLVRDPQGINLGSIPSFLPVMYLDLEDDPWLDALTLPQPADVSQPKLALHRGESNGSWTQVLSVNDASTSLGVTFGDLNRDGVLDLIANVRPANEPLVTQFYVSQPEGGYVLSYASPSRSLGRLLGQLRTGDFNADGFLDVAYGLDSTGILFGDGAGGVTQEVAIEGSAFFLQSFDVDGDGHDELLGANEKGSQLWIYQDGVATSLSIIDLNRQLVQLLGADVNGDGLGDLVMVRPAVGSRLPGYLEVLVGRGNTVFPTSELVRIPIPTGTTLSAADLTGDGVDDVVMNGPNQFLSVYSMQRPVSVTLAQQADFNGNTQFDAADLRLLEGVVRASRPTAEQTTRFDMTRDGQVDVPDITYWVEDIYGSKSGDINLDRHIDFADFLILVENFGSQDASWESGDVDSNGTVDFGDFLLLAANFGFGG